MRKDLFNIKNLGEIVWVLDPELKDGLKRKAEVVYVDSKLIIFKYFRGGWRSGFSAADVLIGRVHVWMA